MLERYGWYMDAIYAEEYDGIQANYHTHGVQANFNHIDFQIVLIWILKLQMIFSIL
ncbi:hypothetical protein [Neobacillus niacini]|uniref:hypothetical protein n=1 Tax=Neobacillus niacini TaxID=86668 RepID=UPI00300016D4